MKLIPSLFLPILLLIACSGSKQATSTSPSGTTGNTTATRIDGATGATFARRVAEVKAKSSFLTASAKVKITGVGKDLSVNGSLKMKRDDVVRLSLRFLGMEVGLLEFTPQDVLVVDRVNKQYVRAAYGEVSFLKAAGLDFYSLQALFWNELFVPGQRDASKAVARFGLERTNGKSILTLTDTPRLSYAFTISSASSLIEQLKVKAAAAGDKGEFLWTYADFQTFSGRTFPTSMQMQVTGTGKDVGLNLQLSSLKTDSDWQTRTTVSSKYKRRAVDEVFRSLNL